MHSRPKFFAKVMGELLFWVGEDKMLFGGDYNIWTPKWQIEGLVDWQMPDDEAFTDYAKLTTATKKKILGLNAARLYDIPVPAELQLGATEGHGVTDLRAAVWRALDTVLDPELDDPITDLDFVESCTVSGDGVATVVLRLPTFFRKAALAGQDRVARPLVDGGAGPEELAGTALGDVPPSAELDRMRHRRAVLGLPHGDDAPLLVHADGACVTAEQVPLHLRRARLQRVGIETNGAYCTSLLQARYPAVP